MNTSESGSYTTAPSTETGAYIDVFANLTPPREVVSPQSLSASTSVPNISSVTDHNTNGGAYPEVNGHTGFQIHLDALRSWGVHTFKCTMQLIEEKLGSAPISLDPVLDEKIVSLRQMNKQYCLLHDIARQLMISFAQTLNNQRLFSDQLRFLSVQQPELKEGFTYNAETQRVVSENGGKVLAALEQFVNSIRTLIDRTFADTFATIKSMESARIQYDVYRKELDSFSAPTATGGGSTTHTATTTTINTSPKPTAPVSEDQKKQTTTRFNQAHERFENLKASVDIKLNLLHDNRIRVMQHQLILLHNATSAYFSGNNQQLEQTLREFNLKTKNPNSVPLSWLEKTQLLLPQSAKSMAKSTNLHV